MHAPYPAGRRQLSPRSGVTGKNPAGTAAGPANGALPAGVGVCEGGPVAVTVAVTATGASAGGERPGDADRDPGDPAAPSPVTTTFPPAQLHTDKQARAMCDCRQTGASQAALPRSQHRRPTQWWP